LENCEHHSKSVSLKADRTVLTTTAQSGPRRSTIITTVERGSCYLTPSTPATPATPASNIKGAADGGGVTAGVVSYSNNHRPCRTRAE